VGETFLAGVQLKLSSHHFEVQFLADWSVVRRSIFALQRQKKNDFNTVTIRVAQGGFVCSLNFNIDYIAMVSILGFCLLLLRFLHLLRFLLFFILLFSGFLESHVGAFVIISFSYL